ncbi:unnamed protein product [Clonostachys chloroleuca]|uniref:Uncharacterized protein n=1 Tax=Clonostachys chloroleuca TaxID=1926264 RepID=A0AA35Q7R6_9HYPO|nr:unnamed protein product [Clonostachys chloroleuca]
MAPVSLSLNDIQGPLNVEIDLQANRIIIGFPNPEQAKSYHKIVQSRDRNGIVSCQLDGYKTSLRLPGRIISISASTRCGGLCFNFADLELAKWWVDELLIWKFVEGSNRKVYVDRRIGCPQAPHTPGGQHTPTAVQRMGHTRGLSIGTIGTNRISA